MAKRNIVILTLYIVLALVLTWPLVTQFGDHVPGTTTWAMDEYGYVWNNWWFKHAVFDLSANPFQTNFIFYPIGTSLVLYTFTLLHVLLGLPIQFAFGLIPASNVELLFAFAMSGFGAFLLAHYVLRFTFRRNANTLAAALVAGAVFAFASNRFVYAALGHYNVVATEWMPFYILFLLKTVREPKWSNALLAGVYAAFALYVEPTDGVLLALFTLLYLLFVWRAVLTRAVFTRLAVVAATAGVLVAPLLVATLDEIFNSGYSLPGWGDSQKLVADLVGLVTPTSLQPFNRDWVHELDLVRQGTSHFADVNTVFLGYVTLALALFAAARYWKTVKMWVVSALAFIVLSFGPLLHIRGQSVFDLDGLQVTFPLPYLLLHYIPLLKENRVPNRFSVLVMLSLAVLVGFTLAWVNEKVKGKSERWSPLLAFGFLILILAEHLSVPLPLTDSGIPAVYGQIARDPGDFAVLTLPLGWRNSFGQQGAEDTRTQYYQSAHGKYLFTGNIQRNPPFLFDYFDRVPIFHSLSQIELYHEVSADDLARDKAIAPALMTFFDVRYVVIQPSIPGRPPYSDTRGAVIDYVMQTFPLGEKMYDRDGVIAYRVNQAALPSKQQIDFGTAAAHAYQGEGWDVDQVIADENANWANQSSARVLFPIREISDYQATLRALPFTYPQSPAQTMELVVNGQSISKFNLKDGWQDYTATVPAGALRSGLNDVWLKFGYAVRPRDVLPPNSAIGSTGVPSPVDIQAQGGDIGSIKIDGREASALGRGYNVVVVDPKTGRVVDSAGFNTADDIAQSRLMTGFIDGIPDGMIVAVASQETAAQNVGERTVAGLRSLGGQVDPRKDWGRAYALIGVKGASAGRALEQWSVGAPSVSVGHSADVRTLAAAVASITIEKK